MSTADEQPVEWAILAPYTGRFVALIGNSVAGVGQTAREAQRRAHANRPREKSAVRFVEDPQSPRLTLPPLIERLGEILDQLEEPVYLVGGAVRDALRGTVSNDLDFVVPQRGISISYKVGNALRCPAYALDTERDTGRVVLAKEKTYLDFARRERSYFIAMFQAGPPEDVETSQAGQRAFTVLRRACEGLVRHLPPAERPPVHMMSYHVWAMCHGIAELFGRDDTRSRAPIAAGALLEAGTAIYLRGLGLIPEGS